MVTEQVGQRPVRADGETRNTRLLRCCRDAGKPQII
jgi:hypothetical protein